MYRATKAIILAAGKGERLLPLTATTPKPLIAIEGTPLIERLIKQLKQAGIEDIVVVTGHLHEQFDYLREQVRLVYNPHYERCNNISSLYMVREALGECMILDGDLIVNNVKILDPVFEQSGYCSVPIREWVQEVGQQQVLRTLRNTGYQLYSISFWTAADSEKLKQHLHECFPSQPDLFWDDIPHFVKKECYQLGIRPIESTDIVEIDTLEELKDYVSEHEVR